MDQLQRFIDAYLSGDSLFRFVYKPATDELFLEDELEEKDNGKFLYVPFKNSQELYMEMSYFADEQPLYIREKLQKILMCPSPIGKFEKLIAELGIEEAWIRRKGEYAKKHIYHWMIENSLNIQR